MYQDNISSDSYLYSHHLSALKCIDIVRRSYIGITSGSKRVKCFSFVSDGISFLANRYPHGLDQPTPCVRSGASLDDSLTSQIQEYQTCDVIENMYCLGCWERDG